MAIGDQKNENGELIISKVDLLNKYNNLIKEAISNANPNLEITRADESASQGMISNDIINKLMFSDFVIVDITHPNPNVFYELGLRHACKQKGTIIIKDKNCNNVPFDISHLRYIEYEDSTAGLAEFKVGLQKTFQDYEKQESITDNQFQDQAKLLKFDFPKYNEISKKAKIINLMVQNPKLLELFGKEDPKAMAVLSALKDSPEIIDLLAEYDN